MDVLGVFGIAEDTFQHKAFKLLLKLFLRVNVFVPNKMQSHKRNGDTDLKTGLAFAAREKRNLKDSKEYHRLSLFLVIKGNFQPSKC